MAAGAAALFAAAAWGLSQPALAQRKKAGPTEVSVEELMKPGPLPDLVLGKADAPITVVEYASMTCGHCANFHTKVFPTLKEKYVDTGKVRFIMREFPLDNLAAAASMLARCAGEGKTFPLISVLFAKQDEWAFVKGDPRPELFKFAKQAGFTQESFDKCLTDQKLLDDIAAVRARAADTFGVNSTPTFFINGKKIERGPDARGVRQGVRAAVEELRGKTRGALPGRQTVSALIVAAALAGCTGEGPTLGSLSSGVEATAALQQPGATPDTPRPTILSATGPRATVGRREVIENPSIAEIMKPGELPEMALGRKDAPVTIVQYASMTCPYCRQFQIETFPVLKREYIDTGKVRYVLRAEFPIGKQSGLATIALRCAPPASISRFTTSSCASRPPGSARRCARTRSSRLPRRWG